MAGRPRRVDVEGIDDSQVAYSTPAVTVDGWVFASAQIPRRPPPDAANPFEHSELERHADEALQRLDVAFRDVGADLRHDAARIQWWLAADRPSLADFEQGELWSGIDDLGVLHEIRQRYIDPPLPGSTGIGVRQLMSARARLCVGAIGICDPEIEPVEVSTADLPDLPDVAAVRAGDWIFTVGLIASDWRGDFMSDRHMGEPSFVAPEARTNPYVWFGSPIQAQTDYVLGKLDQLAEAAGSSLDRAVRAEVFIGHPSDLYGLDRIWRRWFPDSPPARTVVPYSALAGRGVRVEIALTLLAGDSQLTKETIETSQAPEPTGPSPQAVAAGPFVFLSGQGPLGSTGVVPAHLLADPNFRYSRDVPARQAAYTIDNIAAVCEAAGSSLDAVCWRNVFLDDLAAIPSVMRCWSQRSASVPAGTEIGLGPGWPVLAPRSRLVIDTIAHRPMNLRSRSEQ